MVKVIASQIRKGNVVELDDKLHVVLLAESFHPGKGTPTTQIDMRRINDGVKVSVRYKTTEQVEKAMIDEQPYTFLYEEDHGFAFMQMTTYEQISVPKEVVGDRAPFLAENMECQIGVYNDLPVSIELPARMTLEVTETEPAVKGQTAASSYKPAILSNGVRTMVPPFVAVGTRIVVMTEDASYVERAKD
jgi:elongation factor P